MEPRMKSTITTKGQATIPKEVRDHLHVKSGDQIKFFIHRDGSVFILPVVPVSTLRGILKSRRKKPMTIEEMDEAIGAGIVDRYWKAVGGKRR
jgi:antitoxin PrlF